MTLKFKPAIAIVCLGLAAGVAFSVEPGKRTSSRTTDELEMPGEYEEIPPPQESARKKSSRTQTQKAPRKRTTSSQKTTSRAATNPGLTSNTSPAKASANPFEEIEEQDAFLNDLLSDEPAEPKSKTPARNTSRNVVKSRETPVDEIPRLKDDDELPDFRKKKIPANVSDSVKSTPQTEAFDELPPIEKKPVLRTSAEDPRPEMKTAFLIPLVNLSPEEALVPQVSLSWSIEGPVTLGQETHCKLIVRNPGTVIAQQVTVEARLGDRVKLISSNPQGLVRDNLLSWELGNLQPDGEVVLETVFVPEQPGELPISAIVKLGSGSVTRFLVEEPQLAVRMSGEPTVISGEIWNAEVTLMNPGTGAVRNARLESELPEGIMYEGNSRVSIEVGEIPPGESRRVPLPLVCAGKGPQQLVVKASGVAVEARESELSWQVLAPDLELKTEGPSRRFVSRPAQYRISLTNNGTTVAENVRIACIVPAGFELKDIGQEGQYDPQSNTISWVIDQIGEGESQQLSINAVAQSTGQQLFLVRARSDHGGEASATCETQVDGITSVVMTVRDLDDPIEVGVETGYVLNLQNDGTQRLSDLEILCELPPEVEFLSGTGPTEVEGGKGVIRIGRIAALAPGEELSYQLKFRGNKEGSFRMHAKLTSPELSKPVLAEELTRIYED